MRALTLAAVFIMLASSRIVVAQAPPPPTPSGVTVVIGFEDINSGGVGDAEHQRVTSDYPGVTFDGPFVVDFSKGRQALAFPHSGTRAIMLCTVGVPCSEKGFAMRFAEPQARVRVWVGALYLRQNATVSVTAMDVTGAIVAHTEDTVTADAVRNIGTALEVQTDSNRIASVSIRADNPDGTYLAFDDVEFERAASASPIVVGPIENPIVDTLQPERGDSGKASAPWWRNSWLPVLIAILLLGAGATAVRHWKGSKPPVVKPRLADSGLEKRIASIQERNPMTLSIKLSLRPGSATASSHVDQDQ